MYKGGGGVVLKPKEIGGRPELGSESWPQTKIVQLCGIGLIVR
jgi:hypothetical protein